MAFQISLSSELALVAVKHYVGITSCNQHYVIRSQLQIEVSTLICN